MLRKIPSIPVKRRDIGWFVVVVLTLGWLDFPATAYENAIDQPPPVAEALVAWLIPFSPLIAVAVLVHHLQLGGGLRGFLRERFHWRTDARWYLVAVGLCPALFALAYVGSLALDLPLRFDRVTASALLLEVLTLAIIFNLIENYAWRGFLQEALQSRMSALAGTLVVGVVWGLWHVPLLILPGGYLEAVPLVPFMIVIVGESVIIGWLYNSTEGSVLHAAIMHTSFNGSFGVLVFSMIAAGTSVTKFYTATAVVIWIAALAIVYWTDPATLRLRNGDASRTSRRS